MATRWAEGREGSAERGLEPFSADESPAEVERYRAWIAVKLFQGLGLMVFLVVAVVLFDSW
ncbi:MAG: hypothetical protein JWQ36_1851 [Enterovirga sp.]|jgi:hypothetical protein|nr:hypothetical protein [Enterovirga sp.]